MKKTFTIQKIRDGIHLITEPYFHEHANLYLIEGTEYDVLIDCGLGLFDIKQFLRERGFRPKVFLTHAHFDHMGGVKYFNPGEILATDSVLRNAKNRNLWGLEHLQPSDFDAGATRALGGTEPSEFCKSFTLSIPPGIEPLSDTSIIVGPYEFQLIPAPGHTDDSVLLYDKKSKILISGDALYDGKIYDELPNSDKTAFRESLASMKACDVILALPGHNQILDKGGVAAVIERWSPFHRK